MNALRTIAVSAVDIGRELVAAARERRDDVRPRVSRGGLWPLLRPGTTVISRDVVVFALLEDMLAGRPVAYADFLGYDEAGHHAGLERADTLAVLRTIDQQIGRLHRAAALAPRDYHLVCLSDHGLTQGEAFAARFGETVESLVGRLCGADPDPATVCSGPRSSRDPADGGWQIGAALGEGAGPVARRLRARIQAGADTHDHELPAGTESAVPRVAPGVVVTVSGHTASISFADLPGRVPLEEIERHWPDLLPGLVDHAGIGFVLVQSAERGPVVLGRDGVHRLATGEVLGTDPLAPYGEHAAELVARVSGVPALPGRRGQQRLGPGHRRGLPLRAARRLARRARRAAAARLPGVPAVVRPARRGGRRRAAAPGVPRLAHRPRPPGAHRGGRGRRPEQPHRPGRRRRAASVTTR